MGRWRGLAMGGCMLACAGCLGGESLGDQHPAGFGGSRGTGGSPRRAASRMPASPEQREPAAPATAPAGPARRCSVASTTSRFIRRPVPMSCCCSTESSSMNDDSNEMPCTGGCGATSKWALLSAAIDRVVSTHPSANWGLALFGSDDVCGVNAGAVVDVAEDAASSNRARAGGDDARGRCSHGGGNRRRGRRASSGLRLQSQVHPPGDRRPVGLRDGRRRGGRRRRRSGGGHHPRPLLLRGVDLRPRSGAGLGRDGERHLEPDGQERRRGSAGDADRLRHARHHRHAAGRALLDLSGPPTRASSLSPVSPAPETSLTVSATTVDGQRAVIPKNPLAGWSFTAADESPSASPAPPAPTFPAALTPRSRSSTCAAGNCCLGR